MKRLLAILFCLLFATTAQATAYYVSDCATFGSTATGNLHAADVNCVQGDNNNNGTSSSTPWRTAAKAATMITSTMVGGDTLNFARGGVWSGASMAFNKTFSLDGTNPLVIQAYTSSWCTGDCTTRDPELICISNDEPCIKYGASGSVGVHSGLTVKNITVVGLRQSGSVSVATGTPGVVTWTGSALANNTKLRVFSTSGSLPAGLTNGESDYYAVNVSGATFNLALTSGGTPLNLTTTGSDVKVTTHPAETGFWIINGAKHVVLDSITAQDATFGVLLEWTQSSMSGMQEFFTLKYSAIRNNSAEGVGLFGGDAPSQSVNRSLVENNYFESNGWARPTYDHAMYIAGTENTAVRHNTFVKNTFPPGSIGGCVSSVFVTHNTVRGLTIADNTIDESTFVAHDGCYGFDSSAGSAYESLHDITYAGNRVVNVGTVGYRMQGVLRGRIDNNECVWTQGTDDRICVSVQPAYAGANEDGAQTPDDTGGQVWVRNNSAYIKAATGDSVGIDFSENGHGGTGNMVCSNAIYFGSGSSQYATGIKYNSKTAADFTCADYNIVQRSGGATVFSDKGVNTSGFDVHSQVFTSAEVSGLRLKAEPAAADGWHIRFSASSAAINAAHPTYGTRFGTTSKPKSGARDVGACEYRTGDECSDAVTSLADAPVQGSAKAP